MKIDTIMAGLMQRILRTEVLARLPILVYRMRLGWVFGSRMVMIEHIGRTTRKRRQVVLEVIATPAPDRYVVASGFGHRAQWFRNVLVDPQVRIWVGRRRSIEARARRLTTPEADSALRSYIDKHPRAWAMLSPTIEKALGAPVVPYDTVLPMLEFRVA